MSESFDSFYASAKRMDSYDIQSQVKLIDGSPIISNLLDVVPSFIAILNSDRQILFANKAFRKFFNEHNISSFLGMRPGEALNCIHSNDCLGGCGTSEACSVCGAVNAIITSQKTGSAQHECRISNYTGESFDLMINTQQYKLGNDDLTYFIASDISDKKRRDVLEKIFLHDLINTAGVLQSFLELIDTSSEIEKNDNISLTKKISGQLIDEILAQRELLRAEDNELQVNPVQISTKEFLIDIASFYENHAASKNVRISIDINCSNVKMITDKTLLRRVIGNLIKNALEASVEGGTILLNCTSENNYAEFSVHNGKGTPKEVQLQIFQRSFSTKGHGRGLGTYSVKLLTEKYLHGRVYFESNDEKGTTFYARYPLVPAK